MINSWKGHHEAFRSQVDSHVVEVTQILSVNYSGSHLLAQLLGAHSKCASIGELKNLRKVRDPAHRRNLISDLARNSIYDDLVMRPESEWHEIIHARIAAAHPCVSMLVDNSKKIEWARRFVARADYRMRLVHLVRDPRALMRRWLNLYSAARHMRQQRYKQLLRSGARMGVALFGSDEDVLLQKWLVANRRITQFIAASGCPAIVLTYHDLATRTEDELQRLMPELGLKFERSQLEFGSGRSFGTRKAEYVELNQRSEIRFDCRWKEELPLQVQQTIVGNKEVGKYLGEIGLAFCDNGLTRRSGTMTECVMVETQRQGRPARDDVDENIGFSRE